MVHSHLEFMNVVWGCAGATSLDSLVRFQRRAVRYLFKKSHVIVTTDELFGSLLLQL